MRLVKTQQIVPDLSLKFGRSYNTYAGKVGTSSMSEDREFVW